MAHRTERVNNLIRREISELLQRHVKDPRLSSFIAITEVSTSPDLKYATVFVSSIGSLEEREEIVAALSGASGFLRNELARRLRLRHIPELSFRWDDSIERGARLLDLIDKVGRGTL
ncbi:30S ribosome-binding factor RbfA [Chloroflexota bacterium]